MACTCSHHRQGVRRPGREHKDHAVRHWEQGRQGRAVTCQAQGFVYVPANGQVVDGDLLNDAFRVDDEEAAESDAQVLDEDPVSGCDVLRGIGENGDVQVPQAASVARRLQLQRII